PALCFCTRCRWKRRLTCRQMLPCLAMDFKLAFAAQLPANLAALRRRLLSLRPVCHGGFAAIHPSIMRRHLLESQRNSLPNSRPWRQCCCVVTFSFVWKFGSDIDRLFCQLRFQYDEQPCVV